MLAVTPGALVGGALLCAFLLGLALTPFCGSLGRALGAVDYPRHDQGASTVPRMGGLAIYLVTLLTLLACLFLTQNGPGLLAPISGKLLGFTLGATLVLALGLIDDVRGLRARWKLAGEVLIALVVYYWGLRVEVVTNPFNPGAPLHLGSLEMPLNVLWLVLAMNAMNLIDGMDGLAGGVFMMAMVLLLGAGLLAGNLGVCLVVAALIGAAAAFLRYNYFSGSIYLGDAGSLLLGYCLAAFVPLFTPKAAGMAAAIIPMAVLSVPIAEVVVTTVRRVWKGVPLGHPDQGHAHHRMLASGMDRRWVTFFFQAVSFLCGLVALGMTFVFNQTLAYLMAALWLALLGLFVKIGYFRHGATPANANGNGTGIRVPIFLDMDRVLHRQLHELKQSASEAELHQRLADLARDLGLATLSFRRPGPEGWREVAWSLPPEEVPGGELITVTLSDGPAGAERYWELAASVASASFDQSWPRLINWLRGLAHAAAQAMDNQKP